MLGLRILLRIRANVVMDKLACCIGELGVRRQIGCAPGRRGCRRSDPLEVPSLKWKSLLGCAQDALVDLGTHDIVGGDPGGKAGVVGGAQALLQHRRRLGQREDKLVGGAYAYVDAGIDAIGKLGWK